MKKFLVLLFAVISVLTSCKKDINDVTQKPDKITYRMVCTDCQVIYVSDTIGTQSSEFHKNSDWSYTFYGKKNQELLFLAYNTSGSPQAVTATILQNDTVLSTQTRFCPVSSYAFCADTIR